MSYLIRCEGHASGAPGAPMGAFLAAADVNAAGGRGVVEWSSDPATVLKFPTPTEAMEAWRQQSTVAPVRADGQANRPLTAYTITVVPLGSVS